MSDKQQRSPVRLFGILLGLLVLAGAGAVYWHSSGRVSFEGEVRESIRSLSPAVSGVFSRIEVTEGQSVRKGQVLIRLDDAAQRKSLAEERQKLAQFEALLPPQYSRHSSLGTVQEPSRDEETLEERLSRQRKEEEGADRRVQQAADREAQASVSYSRAVMLADKGKLSLAEREAAEHALAEARRETLAAKSAFETLSRARVATMAEMARVRENQQAVGADALPATLRIKNYELQRERVNAAAAALDDRAIKAPEDGVVTEIVIKPGDPARVGLPCIYIAASDSAIMIVAQAPDDVVKKLRPRQQCLLEITGAPDNPFTGYISNILPRSAAAADKTAGMRVQIAVTGPAEGREQDAQAAPALHLFGGAKADVTVLLRKALYEQGGSEDASVRMPEAAPQAPPPAGSSLLRNADGATPGSNKQAPPPGEKANPEGRILPPVHPQAAPPSTPNSALQPLEGNRSLPQLPPMQAPERITGTGAPEAHNNPSLLTPEILEREEAKRDR